MATNSGRNDPCPCGSGKKYKNCCADLKIRKKSPAASTEFQMEPGSYEVDGQFLPSIVCYKKTTSGNWEFYYGLIKLEDILSDEEAASAISSNDLEKAFELKHQFGGDYVVGEYLRDQGYLELEDFNFEG